MEQVKITIIGAGVVGLAIAHELSRSFDNIIVLEKNKTFGQETSSRSSEVIHSGIYYTKDSLKTRLCVEGADLLYAFCEKNSVPYSKIGKLITANDEGQIDYLKGLFNRGINNNVKGLMLLDKAEVCRMEPNVNAFSAIFSPQTGIFDSHSFMKKLYYSAKDSGVMFSLDSEVDFIEKKDSGYVIGIKSEDYRFFSSIVVNAAGLYADKIAQIAGIEIDRCNYRLRYSKGSYFSYSKRSPVKILIYPVPHRELKGLGIHATLDLGGRLRFGPDIEPVDKIDYSVDNRKKDFFFESASLIIKNLDREAFTPDTAGIRPQIKGEGEKDFIIRDESDKGLDSFINLIGIESPGLTASLAIAKMVRDIIISS